MNRKQFEVKCQQVSDTLGFGGVNFFEDGSGADVCEDDGTLHITRAGVRACFDVSDGQSDSGKEQNDKSRKVLKELGINLTKSAEWSRVLVDEIEEDEDECPCCGRGGYCY